MNELLQKHGCANVFTIPEGLKELMSDISREVLREQPAKIYDFIANYLSVLLITREHGLLAVRILDDLCDCRPSVAEHLKEVGLSGEQAATIADIIKEEVEVLEPTEGKEIVKEAQIIKKILTKVVLDEQLTAKVCQVARNAYRDHWYRKKILEKNLKVTPEEPWEIAAERTLQIYKSTKPSFSELNRATEKIQAAYRGYHVRRNLLAHFKPKKRRGPKVDLPGPPLDKAASREIDLGPLIDINVREDDMGAMFGEHAIKKIGLTHDPQTAITYVKDVDAREDHARRRRSSSFPVGTQSTKTILHPTQIPTSEPYMQRMSSNYDQVYLSGGEPRSGRIMHASELIQVQSGNAITFVEIPPEVIPDAEAEVVDETKEANMETGEESAAQEVLEVPEEILDDRTEGEVESASIPTSAQETEASDVEDIAEDLITSSEEEGE